MMKILKPPTRARVREHLVIALEVSHLNGQMYGYPATDADLDAIIELYDGYDEACGVPQVWFEGAAHAAALRAGVLRGFSFTYEDQKLFEIRAMIRKGIDHCPVCGITYPTELDHYLPKGKYHLLAIYVRNLVPHCHLCNNKKRSHVGTEEEERFVHAYFDELPDVQFLEADIKIFKKGLSVRFKIADVEGLGPVMRARLQQQIARLKLNARYKHEINPFLVSQVTGLHMAYDAGQAEGVATYLKRQAKVERRKFHKNHFRPVLLAALAEHEQFCSDVMKLYPVKDGDAEEDD